MRILHIANFSWMSSARKRMDNMARHYAMDRKISNGLIRNGHSVWDFSYRDMARSLSPFGLGKKWGTTNMQQYIVDVARQLLPDLILLGHCEIIGANTLVQLREALPNCKIAQWWVDGFDERYILNLREKQPHLDAFFATNTPSHYAPIIGGNDSPSLHYFPNIIDRSVETGKSFAAAHHDYDVFFTGAHTPERKAALAAVANLPDVRCGFFGGDGRPNLGGGHLIRVIAASKMGLNLTRAYPAYKPMNTSDRLVHIIGNGALAIIPRVPDMTNLFTEDEVAYCESDDELPEVVARYQKDDAARRRIAEAGWRRGRESYNEQRVAKFIVEATMGESFSEQYEWLYASVYPKS